METKRITDLTILESLSDAANVLVEENGEAKRVPAGNLGGASSWNDLTDKPFGDVETVLYEGTNLEPTVDQGTYTLTTVVDFPFVEGGQCTVSLDGVEYVTDVFMLYGAVPCIGNPAIMGVGDDNGMPFWAGVGLDGAGQLSFVSMSAFSALSISTVQTKKIDDKYVPSPTIDLHVDTEGYLYATSDTSDTSNRLTSEELRKFVAYGKTIRVLENNWHCLPIAILTWGTVGIIKTVAHSTGDIMAYYTAEYTPETT